MPHGPPGGFRHHGGDRRGGWGQDNWNNNRGGQNRGGYGGAPPPRPGKLHIFIDRIDYNFNNFKIIEGRKPADNNRDSRQNNDRRNDRQDNNRGGNARPAAGNNKNVRGGSTAGNGKFDQRRDGGRSYGGSSGSWNSYGGNSKFYFV